MNALELPSRVFTTDFAKAFCRKVYGFPLSAATWGNWRKWAKIPRRSRECSYDQLCFLVAIAYIRAEDRLFGQGYFRELVRNDIQSKVNDPHFQEMIVEGVRFLDGNGLVAGRDATRALEINGIKIHPKTLYRKIPGFSINRVYKMSELQSALSA